MRFIVHGLGFLFALSFSFSAFATPLKVTASSLRVRTQSGTHVCSIPSETPIQAIGRNEGASRLQVKINSPNCPPEGWVDSRYVRPPAEAGGFEEAKVDANGLSFRSRPQVSALTYRCALDKGDKLTVLPEEHHGRTVSWAKVRLKEAKPGCPSEGWVSTAYIRPSVDFNDLPLIKDDQSGTEAVGAVEPCEGPDCPDTKDPLGSIDLEGAARVSEAGPSPFIDELLYLRNTGKCHPNKAYPCRKGLIQMPGIGQNAAFCGSHHYGPHDIVATSKSKWPDAFAGPMTACAFSALAQEWKRTTCPQPSGCTIQWGDISHETIRTPYTHPFGHSREHSNGNCIDIRPFRTGGFVSSSLTTSSGKYSEELTQKFITMARKFGANRVLFKTKGHYNHMHVCFGDGANYKKKVEVCNNLKVDPNLCPELQ